MPSADPSKDPGNVNVALSAENTEGKVFRAKSGQKRIFALELKNITRGGIVKIKKNNLKLGPGPSLAKGRKLGHDVTSAPGDFDGG